MSFRDIAVDFLKNYKETELKILETTFTKRRDGSFKEQYHILPNEFASENILIPYTEYSITNNKIFLKDNVHAITLHTDWSHLNSSQILCINYFYKFLKNEELLKKLLCTWDINETPVGAEFEYEPGEGSHIDFLIHLDNGKKVFCEIKYTEGKFNPAKLFEKKNDGTIIDRRQIYIERKNLYSNVEIDLNEYFTHYQAVRNIHFGDNGNYTVFLFPAKDIMAHKNLKEAFKCVKNFNQFNIRDEAWEDLLKAIPDDAVQKKYFPYID